MGFTVMMEKPLSSKLVRGSFGLETTLPSLPLIMNCDFFMHIHNLYIIFFFQRGRAYLLDNPGMTLGQLLDAYGTENSGEWENCERQK